MDIAIEDGVNILSILLGGSSEPFHDDAIALVAYSAMEKGIFVCCSACNRGPTLRSMANEAPWILTVGTNTFDRKINVTTVLINKEQFEATDVTYTDGQKILAYINSTSNPLATITFQGTIIGDKNTLIVASFSSRGPSRANPGLLKPEIIGPSVNILAAWPTSVENNTEPKPTFNINWVPQCLAHTLVE
ncbi:putative subtilisin-like protease SDD1-like [Capsicum annuum]|nr:putative subtilisin-like protease SDD1-like [Capsicum annuum]